MASTPSVVLDLGDGRDTLQPLAELGVTVLTQSPISVRPGGPDQPVAAHLGDFATELDTARSVPGLWTWPGNGGSLGANQTVFTIPGGYTPGFVKVRNGPFYVDRFTATDGATVVITGYTFGSSDVIEIEVLKAGAIANTASKAVVDAKLNTTGDGSDVVVAAPFVDAQAYTLAERAGDEVSVMSFMPKSLRAAIRAGTGNADLTVYVRKAVATGKGVYFPKGRYRVTDKITLASGQVIYGDGVVVSVSQAWASASATAS